MSAGEETIDPRRCPLCGADNACGAERGDARCWCFEHPMPRELLGRVPAAARNLVCICRSCAVSSAAQTGGGSSVN